MNVFDIIGPVMIGPSSSHTAGAVRLGYAARKILGGPPRRAVIQLSGSFAQTCRGHGTDRALVAGILGFQPDDGRIRDSLELARAQGLEIIELEVRSDNPRAIRLYEKFGFVRIGHYPGFFKIGGEYFDCELMNLYL